MELSSKERGGGRVGGRERGWEGVRYMCDPVALEVASTSNQVVERS